MDILRSYLRLLKSFFQNPASHLGMMPSSFSRVNASFLRHVGTNDVGFNLAIGGEDSNAEIVSCRLDAQTVKQV